MTDTATTHWALPFTLFAPTGSVVGRYPTEQAARQAARRRGIALPSKPRTLPALTSAIAWEVL